MCFGGEIEMQTFTSCCDGILAQFLLTWSHETGNVFVPPWVVQLFWGPQVDLCGKRASVMLSLRWSPGLCSPCCLF